MITSPQTWSALTDQQRYVLATNAERQRDDAVLYAAHLQEQLDEQTGKASLVRQNKFVQGLREAQVV